MKSKMQTGRARRSSSNGEINPKPLLRTRSATTRAQAQKQNPESRASQETNKPCRAAGEAAITRSRGRANTGKQMAPGPSLCKAMLKAKKKLPHNHRVTDFFPVRRSTRKNRGELRTEARIRLNELIKSGKEEGMRVGIFDGKGRGVITTKPFQRGDYVVEYHGDLIDLAAAKKREAHYAKDPTTGCYMYYFHYRSKGYCVDATKESGRLGRLINHSKSGNCQTKLHPIDGVPHLIVIATRDIKVGEELLYDYGDRSKSSLEAHPWLKH